MEKNKPNEEGRDMNSKPGMNDAECFFRLYGNAIFTVPFYFDHFDRVAQFSLAKGVEVVR